MDTSNQKPRRRRKVTICLLCLVVSLAAGLLCGGVLFLMTHHSYTSDLTNPSFSLADQGYSGNSFQKMVSLIQDDAQIAETVQRVENSVVTLVVDVVSAEGSGQGLGSGVIVEEKGSTLFIITNAHVVENASAIYLYSAEEGLIDLHLVGADSESDIAVVSLDSSVLSDELRSRLTAAQCGDSDNLHSGQLAIAIGSPQDLAYQNSVTVGVISHPRRELTLSTVPNTYIQTDAAINPGNSGGALFDASGLVIGINSNKIALEDVEGIGFAIPVNRAMEVARSLMSEGFVQHLTLGGIDQFSFLLESMADLYHVPMGLVIQNVPSGSTAQKAGLYAGDIITAMNGIPLTSMDDVNDFLLEHDAGDIVTLTVIHSRNTADPLSIDIPLEPADKPGGGFWDDTDE